MLHAHTILVCVTAAESFSPATSPSAGDSRLAKSIDPTPVVNNNSAAAGNGEGALLESAAATPKHSPLQELGGSPAESAALYTASYPEDDDAR